MTGKGREEKKGKKVNQLTVYLSRKEKSQLMDAWQREQFDSTHQKTKRA